MIKTHSLPAGWTQAQLIEVADVIVSNVDKKRHSDELSVLLCNYLDVYKNNYITQHLSFMKGTVTKAEFKKFKLQMGDVIITKDSETPDDIANAATVVENLKNVICGYHLAILRPKQDILLGLYLSHFLMLPTVRHQFTRVANGATRFGLSISSIEEILIGYPILKEQQQIAFVLMCWNKAIEKTELLISAKQIFKKGLMQKLLTKTSSQDKWSKKKLKECLIPAMRIEPKPTRTFLSLGIRSHSEGTFQKLDFKPDKIKLTELYRVKQNDLIVNITFAWEGAIAIAGERDEGALVSHRFPTYEFNQNVAISEYFRYVILQSEFVRKLGLISPGGAGRNRVLSKRDFLNLEINLPSITEQKKIALILNTCDKELELLKAKLDALKQQKKGLMQKLLTGKVRVKV